MRKQTAKASKGSKIVKAAKASQKPQGASKAAKVVKAAPKAVKPQVASQTAPTLDNVYRVGGGYWASVQALRTLGVGKLHPHTAVLAAYRKAMGAAGWKAFAAKADCELSADKRALVNVMVVGRADYGKPLNAIGYEVRWDGREKVAGLFKIGK